MPLRDTHRGLPAGRGRGPLLALGLALAGAAAAPSALAQPVFAQPVPDAAQLDRQQRDAQRAQEERERLLTPSGPVINAPAPPASGAGGPAGPTFVLTAVDYPPSQFLSKAELDALTAPLIGTRIDFATLQGLIDRLNAAYRAKGQQLARAMLPPQSVRDGRVAINLVEGRAGKTTIAGLNRMNPEWARSWIEPSPGEVVDVPALDERIARFMRVTESEAVVDLMPGSAVGTTDLTVTVKEPAAIGLRAYLSNEGNDLTGRAQAGAEMRFYSLAGRGDRLSANLIHSQGADSLAGTYLLPLNRSGGTLGLTAARGKSRIIKGPFAAIGVEGTSASVGLLLRQPVWQAGPWQLDAVGGANRYSSENIIGGTSTGDTRTRTAQGGLAASWRTEKTEFSATAQQLYGRATAASGLTLPGRARQLDLGWVQRFTTGTLAVQLRGQSSQTGSLPSLLQLSVGGPGSVRGYSVGTYIADSGYSGSADYYFRLTGTASAYVFADTALVRLTGGGNRRLSSTGIGADWQFLPRATLATVLSHALNPGLVTNGSRTRLSARLTYQF